MNLPVPVPVTVTVNGETHSLAVPPRTQLAELLRDRLALTGTHLGCEQGVCGACTVMMDGRPVRSCITYAGACDGARIETVEGFAGDAVMAALREVFARHHALQCGFCTPGMLVSARDIVARLDRPDPDRIRTELSGNLCRCTGYAGIVAAIAEVIAGRAGAAAALPPLPARASGFAPFAPMPEEVAAEAPAPAGRIATEGDWTVLERRFALPHPVERVWAHLGDLGAVAACLPGARLDETDGSAFAGTVEIRFGPVRASLAGRGTHAADPAARRAEIAAEGADRAGKSAVAGRLTLAVTAADAGSSAVAVALRFRITGPLAQFNRPELVTAFADQILAAFVANCDAALAGRAAPAADRPLGGLSLLLAVIRARLRALARRG